MLMHNLPLGSVHGPSPIPLSTSGGPLEEGGWGWSSVETEDDNKDPPPFRGELSLIRWVIPEDLPLVLLVLMSLPLTLLWQKTESII